MRWTLAGEFPSGLSSTFDRGDIRPEPPWHPVETQGMVRNVWLYFEVLTEQQLAFLPPRQKHPVARRSRWPASTQVTVEDAVGQPQPYVSDVARQR